MAIAVDAVSSATNISGTSQTTAHTCTGSDLILFVGAWTRGTNTPTATYNGVSMTAIGPKVGPTVDGDYATLFYLINPSTGTNNIVVSLSSSNLIATIGVSYTGAKQSGQPDASNTYGPTTATTDNVSVTTVADNSWGIMVGRTTGSGSIAAGTGTTLRRNAGAGTFQMFDSGGAKTPAGTLTLQGTHTSSSSVYSMASFAPAVTSTTHIKSADGILLANIKSADGVTN